MTVSRNLRGRVIRYQPELDGVRALAVCLIVANHLKVPRVRDGVEMFFVLSGLLITEVLERRISRPDWRSAFYRRRQARLTPALLVMLVAIVLIAAMSTVWSVPTWAVLSSATYTLDLTTIFTGISNTGPLAPTWALAAEFQFYLLWPSVLIWLLARPWTRQRMAGLLVSVAVLDAMLMAAASDVFSRSFVAYGPLFRPVIALPLGAAVALTGKPTRRGGTVLLIGGAAAIIWSGILGFQDHLAVSTLLISMGTAMLLRSLRASNPFLETIRRFLRHRRLTGLGRMGYSVALWNLPVIMAAQAIGIDPISNRWWTPLVILAILGVSFTSFRLIELPFLDWLSPSGNRGSPRAETPLLDTEPLAGMRL